MAHPQRACPDPVSGEGAMTPLQGILCLIGFAYIGFIIGLAL
jgi:hypothetical protein